MAEKTDREFVEWCAENFEFLADPDDGTPIDPDRKIVLFTSEDEDRLSRLSGGATHDWDISHCTLAMLRLCIAESRTQVAALTAEREAAKAELAAAKQDTARLDWLFGEEATFLQIENIWTQSDGPDEAREMTDAAMLARAPEGTPPAIEMRCVICKDPAVYHADESAWRHKNTGLEGGQWACEKYGYPIEVETAEGTEGKDKDGEA